MMITDPAIQALSAYFTHSFRLGNSEKNELARLFVERRLRRRELLLQPGEVCRHFTFVVAGCCRFYALDQSGKEHNLEFVSESDWLCDLDSFYGEQPSSAYMQALDPVHLLQISRLDLIHLYTYYPKFNTNFRIITERKYAALQRRVLQSLQAPAEERYQAFLQQYPALGRRLPNTHVASYLGITPEFLSKIRRRLAGSN